MRERKSRSVQIRGNRLSRFSTLELICELFKVSNLDLRYVKRRRFSKLKKAALIIFLMELRSSSDKTNTDNSSASLHGTPDAHSESTKPKVLVIDDDAVMRQAIGFMLRHLKVDFDAVSSGEEGLARLAEHSYNLVFLDLVLRTGSHGIKIFEEIGKLKAPPAVILMTASGSNEPIFEEATKLGQQILRKPFSLKEMRQIIDTIEG